MQAQVLAMAGAFGLASAVAVAPAPAAAEETAANHKNLLKLGYARVSFQDRSSELRGLNPAGYTVDVEDTGTPGGSYSRFVSDHVSLEALFGAPLEIAVSGADAAAPFGKVVDIKALPILVSANVHFRGADKRVRPFVGISANYTLFYDGEASQSLQDNLLGETDVDVDAAPGAGVFAGVNVRVAGPYYFAAQVGYVALRSRAELRTQTVLPLFGGIPIGDFDRAIDLKLDPVVGLVSIGRSF